MAAKYFVTGANGCIGGWVTKNLVDSGHDVVALVRGGKLDKLKLIMTSEEIAKITIVQGDIADLDLLTRCMRENAIDRIIHLAALQLPFCKATPSLGARIDVEGTINVFEAAKKNAVRRLTFSSSAAVYGMAREYAVKRILHGEKRIPHSLYGVYKMANEWLGRIYYENDGISSIGLIPSVAYGPLRDQGMTSTPTAAIKEAVLGHPYEISFGGKFLPQYVDDVAKAFIKAVDSDFEGSDTFDIGGESVHMHQVVEAIEAAIPKAKGKITHADAPLPFPEEFDNAELIKIIGPVCETSIIEGVRKSIEIFRNAGLK